MPKIFLDCFFHKTTIPLTLRASLDVYHVISNAILGDPGAVCRVEGIFVGDSLL